GRMFASAKKVAGQLGLDVPIITYQGSLVKTLVDEHVMYERWIPEQAAKYIFEYALKHNYHVHAYGNDQFFALTYNEKVQAYTDISKVPYTIEPDYTKLLDLHLTKMLIIEQPDVLDAIAAQLKPLIGDQVH